MNLAFFIYTQVFMVICVVTSAVCVSAYLVSHRRIALFAAAMFLFYLIDVSIIFQDEFLAQNLAYDQSLYYHINYPYLKIVLSGGFLQCLWLIVCDYLDERRTALLVTPVVAFVLACLAVLWAMPESPLQQFLYYSMRQGFLIWVGVYAFARFLHCDNEADKLRMGRFLVPGCIYAVLVVCVLAEDAFVILVLDPGAFTPEFPLYLSERNFSENVLLILFAWLAVRASADTLALRFERPPQREDQPVQRHIDDLLPTYCKKHGLSGREAEVLRLVLMGKGNQNIASELTLAIGTIKTHVHNILKKTGQPDREHLKRDFWSD